MKSDPKLSANQRPDARPLIRLLWAANVFFARLYHRTDVISPHHIPIQGPAILICNHISPIDPFLLQAVVQKRLITWIMAKEYVTPTTRWFFDTIEVIPVERSGRDSAPLRAAIRELQAGKVLGIFPEGRIAVSREMLPFQTGVALMAIKNKVPVYPAYIDGTQRGRDMLRAGLLRQEATLAFGPAVEFDRSSGTNRESLEAATAAMREAIERLRQLTLTRPRRVGSRIGP